MTSNNEDAARPPQAEGRRQFVWLIRYGKTDPPLLENIGNYDSDLHDPEGIAHAKAVGDRLASSPDDSVPKIVYSDPFLRCMRTADVIVKTLNSSATCTSRTKIRVEDGTTEWQVPSLLVDEDGKRTHPRSAEELVKLFPDTVDQEYRSVNPQGSDRATSDERGDGGKANEDAPSAYPPRFPETEEQLHRRCQCTIRRILADVTDSFAIVGHAPCVQSMALALMGGETAEDCPELGPWSLGGLTLFSRILGTDKWTLLLYSDTSHMPSPYKDGKLGQWSLPSFDR